MVPTAGAVVAEVWVVIVVVAGSAVEEEVFEEAVAGAEGIVGRFRSGGDYPDAPRTQNGSGVTHC
jgi:hypothetical protein